MTKKLEIELRAIGITENDYSVAFPSLEVSYNYL